MPNMTPLLAYLLNFLFFFGGGGDLGDLFEFVKRPFLTMTVFSFISREHSGYWTPLSGS